METVGYCFLSYSTRPPVRLENLFLPSSSPSLFFFFIKSRFKSFLAFESVSLLDELPVLSSPQSVNRTYTARSDAIPHANQAKKSPR